MRYLKESHHSSVFPVKLLMVYIFCLSQFPFLDYLSIWDNCEAYDESTNLWLAWGLIFCVPLLVVVFLAIRHFQKMPIFAAFMILSAFWYIWDTLCIYLSTGFRLDMDIGLQPLGFFMLLAVFAIPFFVVYLTWRVWPRKQAGGLPAN